MTAKEMIATNTLSFVRSLIDKHDLAWASDLPQTLFDQSATAFLKNPVNDPVDIVSEVNLFDIDKRLFEVNALFDLVARLRTDGLAKELALYNEVLSADADRVTHDARKRIAIDAAMADWKGAGGDGKSPKEQVEEIFAKAESDRMRREALRAIPGHPFNLLEQIIEYRSRYQKEVRVLLARAEGIQVVLHECFGLRVESLRDVLFATRPDAPNPLPLIVDWLRLVVRKMRNAELSQRKRTIYRLFSEDQRWGTQNLQELFKANKSIKLPISLNAETLELAEGEKARFVAFGVAVIFPGEHNGTAEDAAKNSPFQTQARSLRSTFSFDFKLTFREKTISHKLPEGGQRDFRSPGVVERWGGVGAWARDGGSLEQAVALREIPLITNRSAVMEFELVVDENVRTVRGRANYNNNYGWHLNELVPTDIALALSYVVYRDEPTEGA